jgi:predicted Rossmann fold flavoprotein
MKHNRPITLLPGNQYDLIVIGGGPAGMMAAGRAGELKAKVLLIEKTRSLGNKLNITGKGRCNITNIGDVETFIKNYGSGASAKFMYNCFHVFFNTHLIEFLKSRGVEVIIERGGRVFPKSNKADEVTLCLERYVKQNRVRVKYNCRAAKVLIDADGVMGVRTENNEILQARTVVLATGGMSYPGTGSTGDGYKLVQDLKHTVIDPKPSLVPLEIKESFAGSLSGLSLKNVELSAYVTGSPRPFANMLGEMLFTHYGISGPIVLSMSKQIIEKIVADPDSGVELAINFKPALSPEILDARLQREIKENSRVIIKNMMPNLLPLRMIPVFLERCRLPPGKKCGDMNRSERQAIVHGLQDFRMNVKCARPIEEAIVTAGGIALNEIDPKTMESKLLKNLFFCGEVIDIDGNTGGYNLQAAFTTGYVAGEHAAQQRGRPDNQNIS